VLYATYQSSRGAELVYGFVLLPWADTEEVIVDLRAILRLEGTHYLLEESHSVGGEGSSGETELVERAVAPLETLAEVGEPVEQILECILGYASGAGM
jgi:hypothetical protein